ncbi:Uncharacterised protein [Vibrio cholerae]|nr:Uncharacterised protein [Vibrio cholerae]
MVSLVWQQLHLVLLLVLVKRLNCVTVTSLVS